MRPTLACTIFVVGVLAIASVAAEPDPPPIYDEANECVVDGVPSDATVVRSEGQWQVLAIGTDAQAVARRMLPTVSRAWTKWRDLLGTQPDDGRAPYRIFFVPRRRVPRLEQARGFLDRICGHPNHGALLVDAEEEDPERLIDSIAHELFHAFQHASAANPIRNIAGW